ncbi:MAG: (2Fe-2S)-binding protein [Chloroflexi bacterium]|nr:(2Fe-2S)-binding protein [Chloroflexota bacterium]
MSRIEIVLDINGALYPLEVDAHRTLLDVLREEIGLTGTKPNCLEGECGSCSVLIDGRVVNSCLYLAVRAQGHKIVTIEGLADGEQLHPLQTAFLEQGAVQCGYCIPGYILSAAALLQENPNPTDEEMNRAFAGNMCRCTGYTNIRKAVHAAADAMAEKTS